MKGRGWLVKLLSERGDRGPRQVAGHEVTYLSRSGYALRALQLALNLFRLRMRGYRLVFVRISKSAALVAIVVGKFLGMRVAYWQSAANFDIDRKKALLRRFVDDVAFGLIKRGVDSFVTGPESMLDYYATQYGVSRQKLRLLYNDVDIRRFQPSESDRPPGPCRILFVHRFSPIRQTWMYVPAIIDRLNTASSAGCPSELVLVGDGPEQQLVEKAVEKAQAGVAVRFLGARPNSELPEHYQRADIFIMPSYREGFPRVVVEAMAAGLPIVTTDAGGTRDVVGPLQQRYVVSKDEPEAFADRLLELVHSPERRDELARENTQGVQKYATETVAKMLENVLLATASQDRSPYHPVAPTI